jgi:hypothetical protein
MARKLEVPKNEPFRHTENDLNNALFVEFFKANINEKAIRNLIKQGANVNAVDNRDCSILDNIIVSAEDESEKDTQAIRLLLDLGADIHYVNSYGYNCLFSVAVPWRMKTFKMLLEQGINPNCISTEIPFESQLDEIEQYAWITKDDNELSDPEKKTLQEMIRLLKAYGGKDERNLNTDTVKQYIIVYASYKTGLITRDGYIDIQNIPNVTYELIEEFNTWQKSNPSQWKGFVDITTGEDLDILKAYNNLGLELAKRIKDLVDLEITVHYFSIETEDCNMKLRDLNHKVIH